MSNRFRMFREEQYGELVHLLLRELKRTRARAPLGGPEEEALLRAREGRAPEQGPPSGRGWGHRRPLQPQDEGADGTQARQDQDVRPPRGAPHRRPLYRPNVVLGDRYRCIPRLSGCGPSRVRNEHTCVLTEEFEDPNARERLAAHELIATLFVNGNLPDWYYFHACAISVQPNAKKDCPPGDERQSEQGTVIGGRGRRRLSGTQPRHG